MDKVEIAPDWELTAAALLQVIKDYDEAIALLKEGHVKRVWARWCHYGSYTSCRLCRRFGAIHRMVLPACDLCPLGAPEQVHPRWGAPCGREGTAAYSFRTMMKAIGEEIPDAAKMHAAFAARKHWICARLIRFGVFVDRTDGKAIRLRYVPGAATARTDEMP